MGYGAWAPRRHNRHGCSQPADAHCIWQAVRRQVEPSSFWASAEGRSCVPPRCVSFASLANGMI